MRSLSRYIFKLSFISSIYYTDKCSIKEEEKTTGKLRLEKIRILNKNVKKSKEKVLNATIILKMSTIIIIV